MGVWKLAYADLVTAMMAFFMVMWLLTQADLKLRSQIAMYFRSPGVLPGGAAINEELNAARSRGPKVVSGDIVVVQGEGEERVLTGRAKEIEGEIRRAAAEQPDLAAVAQQMRVEVTPEGLAIQVVDEAKTLLFDVASAELKPPVVALLQRIAPVLATLQNPIEIGGHTDARPFPPGSPTSNWQLAFQRADNARASSRRPACRPAASSACSRSPTRSRSFPTTRWPTRIAACRSCDPPVPGAEDVTAARSGPVTDELRVPDLDAEAAAGVPKANVRR
jgi:chemotaxis protein MotB